MESNVILHSINKKIRLYYGHLPDYTTAPGA